MREAGSVARERAGGRVHPAAAPEGLLTLPPAAHWPVLTAAVVTAAVPAAHSVCVCEREQ